MGEAPEGRPREAKVGQTFAERKVTQPTFGNAFVGLGGGGATVFALSSEEGGAYGTSRRNGRSAVHGVHLGSTPATHPARAP